MAVLLLKTPMARALVKRQANCSGFSGRMTNIIDKPPDFGVGPAYSMVSWFRWRWLEQCAQNREQPVEASNIGVVPWF